MLTSAAFLDLEWDRAFYQPGQAAQVTVHLTSVVDAPAAARLTGQVSHLADVLAELAAPLQLVGGEQTVTLRWSPPAQAPRGYGLDLRLEDESGQVWATTSSAFDVLERWTQTPRYGFLSHFAPGRSDADATLRSLTRYHLNALQFYDWMYRHEQFLTGQEPYLDPLGRELSRRTVDALIAAAHRRGVAAMPYTAVYGASTAFYHQHPDWALRKADGAPWQLGEDFLAIMDVRPGRPWTSHLLSQFAEVLRHTDFDGLHLDQYGEPKKAYDAQGQGFDLAQPLAEFIDAACALVAHERPGGAVVFNAVGNWPIEAVAPTRQDLIYIEVWPPDILLADLHRLIVQAQTLGRGQPVVLAAYIDPAWAANVRLMEAVIFASGGSHIALGERDGFLADPYFPKYGVVSPELAEVLRRYYDFGVRYQDVLGPRTQDAAAAYDGRISLGADSPRVHPPADQVWPIVRENAGRTAISLINLLGLKAPAWAEPLATPTELGPTTLQITGVTGRVARAWRATPDAASGAPQILPVSQTQATLRLELPGLAYWDLIVLEWAHE